MRFLVFAHYRDEFKETEHPRDPAGEFTSGGGGSSGGKLKPHPTKAWSGSSVEVKTKISKQDAGKLGEKVVIDYLKSQGISDARGLNLKTNNFPVDLIGDHQLVEVKTGLASNGPSAQHWRATIGQPGKEESAWLKSVDKVTKAKWNANKHKAIIARKEKVLKDYSKKMGVKMKAKTITTILNPDTKTVDIYSFEGFHSLIGWKSDAAKSGYVGSFKYE